MRNDSLLSGLSHVLIRTPSSSALLSGEAINIGSPKKHHGLLNCLSAHVEMVILMIDSAIWCTHCDTLLLVP